MSFWRILLLGFVLGMFFPVLKVRNVELLILYTIVFGCILHAYGKTLSSTPLKDMARWRLPIVSLTNVFRQKTLRKTKAKPGLTQVSKSSSPGRTSGYEPRFLDKVRIPQNSKMFGVPGQGLSSATSMSASRVQAGQIGEINFAKALSVYHNGNLQYNKPRGVLNSVHSFWSVAMPDAQNPARKDAKFDTDIDCIIAGGNTIILIDIKFYKSGNVTYQSNGNSVYAVDNKTGYQVGDAKSMSQNMKMAQERFTALYPKHNIVSYVILMPTNSGTAEIEKIMWPGNIPFVQPEWAIEQISKLSGQHINQQVINNLTKLLK